MTQEYELPKGAEWYNRSKGIYIERLQDRTPEWHERRLKGIGGSEIGGVLGLNDYPGGSVIELFYEKIGDKPQPLEDNNYMLMGRVLEDTVADLWEYYSGDMQSVIENMNAGKKQRRCRNVNGVLSNIKYPHLFLNLDRLIEKGSFNLIDGSIMEDNGALEIKTLSSWVAKKWESGIPIMYVAQVTQACMILDVPYGEIGCLELDSRTLKVYPIEPSQSLVQSIDESSRSFWHDMVIPARELKRHADKALEDGNMELCGQLLQEVSMYEPPADGSDSYKAFLNERWNSEPIEIPADDDMIKAAKELIVLKETVKLVNKQQTYRENLIRQYLQDNDTLLLDEGKITWKTQKDNKRVLRTAGYKPFGINELSQELNEMIEYKIKTSL